MRRQPVDKYDGPTVKGIDVSRWQGALDWDVIRKNNPDIVFAISRTGDGSTPDRYFADNWKNSQGLIRGSYHYFRADRGGEAQAKGVVRLIESAGGMLSHDLPPALDLEDGARKNLKRGVFTGEEENLPVDLVVDEAIAFLETVEEELGVTPLVYTGQTFHWWLSQARPDLAKLFSKYPLWLPSYTSEPLMPVDKEGNAFPWDKWSLWQYTSKGDVMGIPGGVDMNYFRGNRGDLLNFLSSLRLNGNTGQKENPSEELIYKEMGELFARMVSLAKKL